MFADQVDHAVQSIKTECLLGALLRNVFSMKCAVRVVVAVCCCGQPGADYTVSLYISVHVYYSKTWLQCEASLLTPLVPHTLTEND